MPEILLGPTLTETAAAVASWNYGHLVLASGAADAAVLRARIEAGSPSFRPLPKEPCVIMQTSGSSGQAKLVVIPKSTLAYSAGATNTALGGPGHWVNCLPTQHIAGFQTVARPALTGHRLISGGRGTPAEIAACASGIPTGERTYLSLVPTQLTRLLDSPFVSAAKVFSAILVGGASTRTEILQRGLGAGLNLVTTYGMTETCGGCAYNGLPIGDTRIAAGPHGQLTITGSVVAHSYLGSRPFSGTFTTSDSGTVIHGRVQVTGRLDGAITTGGLTVMPQPIERVLEDMGAGAAVVVGIPDARWGEKLVAITQNPIQAPRHHLKPLLEAVPQEFLTAADLELDELPCLESGKPDRIRLQSLAQKYVGSK